VSSSGSGSNTSAYPSSSLTGTTTNTTPTQAQLLAQIALLQTQLQNLIQQAANQGTGTSITTSYVFSRNLKFGSTGSDVVALQTFLIAKSAGQAARTLSKHGTTKIFGNLTYYALVEYQKSVGIIGTGYFGPATRAYINSHE
jgi:murein L,D-transpeptidase YcbB/YkuD